MQNPTCQPLTKSLHVWRLTLATLRSCLDVQARFNVAEPLRPKAKAAYIIETASTSQGRGRREGADGDLPRRERGTGRTSSWVMQRDVRPGTRAIICISRSVQPILFPFPSSLDVYLSLRSSPTLWVLVFLCPSLKLALTCLGLCSLLVVV